MYFHFNGNGHFFCEAISCRGRYNELLEMYQ